MAFGNAAIWHRDCGPHSPADMQQNNHGSGPVRSQHMAGQDRAAPATRLGSPTALRPDRAPVVTDGARRQLLTGRGALCNQGLGRALAFPQRAGRRGWRTPGAPEALR